MRVAILTANLNSFDKDVNFVKQDLPEGVDEIVFHNWTDSNFPPITGLTPRFQYRIPKMFGWQMKPGFDVYIWLDGSMSLQRPDSVKWFIEQLGNNDMLLFHHPWRRNIKEEVEHIEEKKDGRYLKSRYENGLHKECYEEIMKDNKFVDNKLFASTMFVYKDSLRIQNLMKDWFFWQARYFSCDQIPLPYVLWKNDIRVKTINENVFKHKYLLFNKHK